MLEPLCKAGVLNTDNTAISRGTFDDGPCAFMNAYGPATIYSGAGAVNQGNRVNFWRHFHRHGRACPGHRSWHSAATDGRDRPGHDGEGIRGRSDGRRRPCNDMKTPFTRLPGAVNRLQRWNALCVIHAAVPCRPQAGRVAAELL